MKKTGPKKPKEVTYIELDPDEKTSLRCEKPYHGATYGVWYFYRGENQIRPIDSRYLEQHLIDKIVQLMTK